MKISGISQQDLIQVVGDVHAGVAPGFAEGGGAFQSPVGDAGKFGKELFLL